MEGLPNLPGNTFSDPTRTRFHRSQSLVYSNGYAMKPKPECGIGGVPIPINELTQTELDELANLKPTLTYGQARQAPPQDFVPAHVAWDKKVLMFNAWYKQTVHESPAEHFRVRHVKIYYYLEDDSISVVEPVVENSGIPQGTLIRRQRLPKDDMGNHWHWKDLNIGINLTIYGKVFHLYNTDAWSREWLESEGIEVRPVEPQEEIPQDPYILQRNATVPNKTTKTPSDFDKLRQFIQMDRKVLRFYAVWDDRHNMFGMMRQFIIHFYLVNDTLEVREVHQANDGRDPFPVLITRNKIPKDRYDVKSAFPGVVMELTDQEIKEYISPQDLFIGHTVKIYNRRFLIYDCDNFTKAFFEKNFGIKEFTPIPVSEDLVPLPKMEIAPYNGYGSLEDSLQSCLTLVPQPPKKDFIKMLENDHNVLRFEAVLDTTKAEDIGRKFIISYRLADDMISIHEPPLRNSGRFSGKFLQRTRVAKPNCPPNSPKFYGPGDFYIGAIFNVFSHRFVITNADDYVLSYMEQNSSKFPAATIESLRQKIAESPSKPDEYGPPVVHMDLQSLLKEVIGQLKKIAITASNRKDQLFLSVDVDRQGHITQENLRDLCIRQLLPHDREIIAALAYEISRTSPERIPLEDFRVFMES